MQPVMQATRLQSATSKQGFRPFGQSPPRTPVRNADCRATQQQQQLVLADRREALLQLSSLTAAAVLSNLAGPQVQPAAAAAQPQVPQVGTYLPASGIDDLVLFQPDARKTPALRAGTVDPTSPYKFALPPSFRSAACAVRVAVLAAQAAWWALTGPAA